MLRVVFGMNLKYHRTRLGLTQEEAAARCKLSSEYWGKMERGTQAATLDTVEKISVGAGNGYPAREPVHRGLRNG